MRVSFTGHRPDKIADWSHSPEEVERHIRAALASRIERLAVEHSATTFLCGMAPGVDLWAADELLRLRSEGRVGESVRLVLAIPYPDFARSFSRSYRPLYDSVLERADEVVYVCQGYHYGCYSMRNDYLVDNSDLLLAYYEGSEGGTRYTIRRATKQGKRVINIHQSDLFDMIFGEVVGDN